MTAVSGLLVFLSFLFGIFVVGLALYTVARVTFDAIVGGMKSRVLPIKASYKETLKKYFGYYNRLSPSNKKKFERKVQYFISVKKFVPRDIPEVTDEMKALIAASSVQLTFGLPGIFLQHFRRILVYPDDYYSTISKRYHKGEVNIRHGIIVLSWKSFVDGYIDPHDSRNVGLHEMAHALRFENMITNNEYNFFDDKLLLKWREHALEEMARYDAGNPSFLREYAMTNEEEFFAVAVEYFFEQPLEFRENLPNLYSTLQGMLKQDPLQVFNLS